MRVKWFLEKTGCSLMIIPALALSGCWSFDNYTSAQPKLADIAGTYQLTCESAVILVKSGYVLTNNPTMSLLADGSFKMLSMPGCWLREPLSGGSYDGGPVHRSFDSGAGNWKLCDFGLRGGHSWGIQLDFSDTSAIKSTSSPQVKKSLQAFGGPMLKNENSPYYLHFVIGDPDGGESLEFNQVTGEKSETDRQAPSATGK